LHASNTHSITNLVKQTKIILQRHVVNGELDSFPEVPSNQRVRLQFISNNAFRMAVTNFTGKLEVVHGIQTRTLRKEHPDQHWVNAYTRYYLEWLVELRKIYPGVEFFGQDDRANIPVDDVVPLSTDGIVPPAGDNNSLKALDHDFNVGNITLSITLCCNIPKAITGSFFIGNDEDGYGLLVVMLRDSLFDPTEAFDHSAQLVDTLKNEGPKGHCTRVTN
jgi:hypothetical protein